ncbi:MAG: hypothetical protein IJY90_03570 [Clostridia bacterium]|nr:hypothetical protein [Clostridia bacterium]
MTTFFKKHKKQFLGALATCALVAALMLANFFSSFIVPSQNNTETVSSNAFDLYLISLSKSQVEKESKSHASDYQQIGAGGFVWEKDGYYHIISSGYLNKADAELVQSSIKLNQNLDSEILTISFDGYSINGNFSGDEARVIVNLLSSCINFYTSIYDVSISLDTGVYNEISAKLAVNTCHNNFATTLANFNTLYPKPHPEQLSPVYEMATEGYQIGEKLCAAEKVTPLQNYSSILKYRYLEIMNLYYNFCNK